MNDNILNRATDKAKGKQATALQVSPIHRVNPGA